MSAAMVSVRCVFSVVFVLLLSKTNEQRKGASVDKTKKKSCQKGGGSWTKQKKEESEKEGTM